MSAAKHASRAQRQLSPDAKGVFVPMTPKRLRRLDADRARLGLSRGGALATIFDNLGDDVVDAAQQRGAAAGAEAADLAELLAPLVDAVRSLDAAWIARANQRQRIGVHSNQIAKLANVEGLIARDGGQVSEATAETLALALQGVQRVLDRQVDAERVDDALRSDVRELLDRLRGAP